MTKFRETGIFALRGLQFISFGCFVVGFIWATSDYLLTSILAETPVTPLSLLLMLYGILGTVSIDGAIRFLQRTIKKKRI